MAWITGGTIDEKEIYETLVLQGALGADEQYCFLQCNGREFDVRPW